MDRSGGQFTETSHGPEQTGQRGPGVQLGLQSPAVHPPALQAQPLPKLLYHAPGGPSAGDLLQVQDAGRVLEGTDAGARQGAGHGSGNRVQRPPLVGGGGEYTLPLRGSDLAITASDRTGTPPSKNQRDRAGS